MNHASNNFRMRCKSSEQKIFSKRQYKIRPYNTNMENFYNFVNFFQFSLILQWINSRSFKDAWEPCHKHSTCTDPCGCVDASWDGRTEQISCHRSRRQTDAPPCGLACVSSDCRPPWTHGSTRRTSTCARPCGSSCDGASTRWDWTSWGRHCTCTDVLRCDFVCGHASDPGAGNVVRSPHTWMDVRLQHGPGFATKML